MTKTFYIHSSFETKKLGSGKKSLKIAGYANTTSKDRAGDIITAEAWAKGVDNFRKNPVLLNQHKHDQPIGRVDTIKVDKKGIFVEASVSEAAERLHGTQTLIEDGALKSFSVGFKVKDGKYNSVDETLTITEVELLEISIVSIPCNQDSLFSTRKSFESSDDYSSFLKGFKESAIETTEKEISDIKAGITSMVSGHYHTVEMDKHGNGTTTYTSHLMNHSHDIVNGIIMEANDHSHDIPMLGVPIYVAEEDSVDNSNIAERPLSPTEEISMNEPKELNDESVEKTEKVVEEISEQEEITDEVVCENEEKSDNKEEKLEEELEEVSNIPSDPEELIPFVNMLSADTLRNGDLVNFEHKMYKVAKIATDQSPIYKFLEIDSDGKECDNIFNINAEEISKASNLEEIDSEETKELHKDSTKENDQMVDKTKNPSEDTQVEITTEAEAVVKTVPNTVSEPEVTKLIEKTGEAIMAHTDAQDTKGAYAPKESEELKELGAQLAKYKDEIKSMQNSKMLYQESTKTKQFSDKEMANAVFLSKLLNRRDVFDTSYGGSMKAVTSVDAFLSNFSSNIYTEMEQQLVIAPMFNRLPVDAKTFRVPVADEDTDGDVAMFKSGTYSTGIADNTNVPTSNQNTMTSVEFTPHKFMATTHLAKDEEEDTVLPLIDFLRAAATRRLARAVDKSVLRGTGALTGFTASPTNAITAGTGYASVINGITNLTSAASLEVVTGSASDKADPTDIAAARAMMGKYGLQLGNDLVYVTSIEGYNNLVTTADFRTVDKFGPNATYLTGSVGAVYGIPIVISEFLDSVGTAGNHIGTLLYKPGFLIAERRGIEIESEYEPRQQVTAMYLSTRFDFKALTTNASSALDTSNYAYASTVVTGA